MINLFLRTMEITLENYEDIFLKKFYKIRGN